jgi:hypothetical protein
MRLDYLLPLETSDGSVAMNKAASMSRNVNMPHWRCQNRNIASSAFCMLHMLWMRDHPEWAALFGIHLEIFAMRFHFLSIRGKIAVAIAYHYHEKAFVSDRSTPIVV